MKTLNIKPDDTFLRHQNYWTNELLGKQESNLAKDCILRSAIGQCYELGKYTMDEGQFCNKKTCPYKKDFTGYYEVS